MTFYSMLLGLFYRIYYTFISFLRNKIKLLTLLLFFVSEQSSHPTYSDKLTHNIYKSLLQKDKTADLVTFLCP